MVPRSTAWLVAIAKGGTVKIMTALEALQDVVRYFNDHAFARPPDQPALNVTPQQVEGLFCNLRLESRYQPLISVRDGACVAHEALLRAFGPDGVPLPPEDVFALPSDGPEMVHLDRLVRTLHALNFLANGARGDLHLNVHPQHLLAVQGGHGQVFETILRHLGLSPAQIVLEIIETGSNGDGKSCDAHLARAIAGWRERGYRIALDDFGRAHSNVHRLAWLSPDIVKLDGTLIYAAEQDRRHASILSRMVAIAHDIGAVAVCEGIETPRHLELAIAAGADQVQGYIFGQPAALTHAHPAAGTHGTPMSNAVQILQTLFAKLSATPPVDSAQTEAKAA